MPLLPEAMLVLVYRSLPQNARKGCWNAGRMQLSALGGRIKRLLGF